MPMFYTPSSVTKISNGNRRPQAYGRLINPSLLLTYSLRLPTVYEEDENQTEETRGQMRMMSKNPLNPNGFGQMGVKA